MTKTTPVENQEQMRCRLGVSVPNLRNAPIEPATRTRRSNRQRVDTSAETRRMVTPTPHRMHPMAQRGAYQKHRAISNYAMCLKSSRCNPRVQQPHHLECPPSWRQIPDVARAANSKYLLTASTLIPTDWAKTTIGIATSDPISA